jgi:3-demethoxyubiquinol 3-hydroxylase
MPWNKQREELKRREALSENDILIRRILRVNHSGEHGAVAIYSSQIKRAQKYYPEIHPWLKETLEHEKHHRKLFLSAMPSRGAKPCRAMYIWKIGGASLGALTALFGRFGVMVCTAAVERTVRKHLVEQIEFLKLADVELASIVQDILKEEDEHLTEAERFHDTNSFAARALSLFVAYATEVLIFISTRGDSRKLSVMMRTMA